MSNGSVSKKQPASLKAIPLDKMRQSLEIVIGWQEAELPSRFAIGSGQLRKLTIRVRKQPVNFMIVVKQSLTTAKNGEGLCKRGFKASRVLLGEEVSGHNEQNRARFTAGTIDEIKRSASDLTKYTNGIQTQFRLLRTTVLDIHKDLNKVNSERERSAFLARLARHLSRDVRISEDTLLKVHGNLEEIENSLNLIIHWWQKVQSEVNYLQTSSESSPTHEQNSIAIQEIKESFTKLERYFNDYRLKMSEIYDDNIANLNANDQKYVQSVTDCATLVISKTGRLEPTEK